MKYTIPILLATLLLFTVSGCLERQPRPQAPSSAESVDTENEPASEPECEPVPVAEQVQAITPDYTGGIAEKKAENSDVVGWLRVPGTTIDNPVLVNPKGDNEYYLTHDFAGVPSKNGTYCADFRCTFSPGTRDGLSRNTTLYGHNWTEDPDGDLFDQLKKFKDPAFARANPYVFFSAGEESMAWEVFAVYDTHIDFPYILTDLPADVFQEVLRGARAASIYDYDVEVSEQDKVLTLSTCSFDVPGQGALPLDQVNHYRFVVMARLTAPDERAKETAAVTQNNAMLTPEEMPVIFNPNLDVFQLDGLHCYSFEALNFGIKLLADAKKAVRAGEITRTGILYSMRDGDATRLPVGTAVYRDPEYADVCFAQAHGRMIPYIVRRDSYDIEKITMILENGDGIMKEKVFTKEENFGILNPFIDMVQFERLSDDDDAIHKRGDTSVRALSKNSLTTFTQIYWKATPASLGREVLVARQSDGWYYADTVTYDQLLRLFE